MSKRTLVAEDLYQLKSVADPQLASNGQDLVYIQTAIDEKKNDYVSNIYYMNVEEESDPVQWTFGTERNFSPRWSPCGEKVAFVSTRSGKGQIYILHKKGGEARQLTNIAHGVSNPVWSPDGKQIAFTTELKPGEELSEKEEKSEENPNLLKPLVVEKMKYKSDAAGFLDEKVKQVAIVNVESGEVQLITSGNADIHLQSWSPDGNTLAVSADLSEDADFSFINDFFLLDIKTNTSVALIKFQY